MASSSEKSNTINNIDTPANTNGLQLNQPPQQVPGEVRPFCERYWAAMLDWTVGTLTMSFP